MKRRVVVLFGGDSSEREVSRVTGMEVAKALAGQGHDVSMLDTARGNLLAPVGGSAPAIGREPPRESEERVAERGVMDLAPLTKSGGGVDCVFIALHGGWGEDGTVQAFFELAGIPYTGSGVLGSALAMDKDRAKRVFRSSDVPTPDWITWSTGPGGEPGDDELTRAYERLGPVVVVKPNAEGSTVGLTLVREESGLREAVRAAARYGPRVLLERYVPGRELTVGILGGEPLPVVEIIPDEGLYTYEAKYTKG